jgi:hypothetical protein
MGGTLSFSAYRNLESPNFQISTSTGYLLSNHLAVGADLNYAYQDKTFYSYGDEYKDRYNVFLAGAANFRAMTEQRP